MRENTNDAGNPVLTCEGKKYLINEKSFMVTYGDGLSNINLNKLKKFHQKHKKIATLSAVRPPARFGVIQITHDSVKYFREKNSLDAGWINGHNYALFGPLAIGATTILMERPISLLDEIFLKKLFKLKISILYLPVTLIRLMKNS